MYKKKFEPVITRVKLNPEQAVLQCACYTGQSWTTVAANKGASQYRPCGITSPKVGETHVTCDAASGTASTYKQNTTVAAS